MRNGNDLGMAEDIVIGEVGNIAGQLIPGERLQKRAGIHKLTPGEVQKYSTLLHHAQAGCVYHAPGLPIQRQVERDIVALGKKGIHIIHPGNLAGQMQGGIHRHKGIVAVYLHIKSYSGIGNQNTDSAHANNA